MLLKEKKSNFFLGYLIKKIKKACQTLQKFSKKYPLFSQFFQLTFLYFYATLTLSYSIINSLGFCPEFIYKSLPFSKTLLSFSLLKTLATPEKTFLLYLIAVELILNGKSISLLVKYNFALVFILEMIQNLIICIWDLLSHRDMDMDMAAGEIMFSLNGTLAFFTVFFFFFFSLYLYCYFTSIRLKFVSFPSPFTTITDSAGFWLNIKRNQKKEKK